MVEKAMTRPRCKFRIEHCPKYRDFRPVDFPCSERNCIEITEEELEALRLKNLKGFDQTESAKKMGVSQSTFQRVLSGAYKKVTEAIVQGKILKIIKYRTYGFGPSSRQNARMFRAVAELW